MSISEKLKNILRDIRWIISIASRPDQTEFSIFAKFLLLVTFAAGVFQFVFHIAGTYILAYSAKVSVRSLAEELGPTHELIAVISSISVIFAILIYFLVKLK